MMKATGLLAAAVMIAGFAGGAQAQDAEAGAKVFRKCQACHVVDKEQNRVGPHLVGLIGRPVAAVDGFKYSDAMKSWGDGKVWDEALLISYLEKPREQVKGTKMAFAGLPKEEDRANVAAYIKQAGGGS